MTTNINIKKLILMLLLSALFLSLCIDFILQVLYKRYLEAPQMGEPSVSETTVSQELAGNSSRYTEFVERFEDVDLALENLRGSSTDNSNISDTGIRYWELQIDTLYNYLLNVLEGEEARALVQAQEEWKQSIDAQVNRKLSANQNMEYVQVLSVVYRDRAYELLDTYKEVLDR